MIVKIILVIAVFNGYSFVPIREPIEMSTIQECTSKALEFLEDAKELISDAAISAECRVGMVPDKRDPA